MCSTLLGFGVKRRNKYLNNPEPPTIRLVIQLLLEEAKYIIYYDV